jgi:hypothetical protein
VCVWSMCVVGFAAQIQDLKFKIQEWKP